MSVRTSIFIIFSLGFGFLTQALQAQTVLDTVCAGARGVSYQVLENVGSTYNWEIEGGAVAQGNGSNLVLVDWGKDTGVYPITVIQHNQHGCPGDTVRAFVWVRGGINVVINGPGVICEGDELVLQASGAKLLTWEFGFQSDQLRIRPTQSKEYTVFGYSDQCGMDTAHFFVEVKTRPRAVIVINPNDPRLNETVRFYADGSKVSENIYWDINQGGVTLEGDEAEHEFKSLGNYAVQLIVIDPNGCKDTANTSFVIEAKPLVFLPNAFTPNGDHLNDVFSPEISDIKFIHLSIFDRWGERIFDGENLSASWDGTYKGQIAAEGVYVYIVEAIGIDNKTYTYNGTLTLIR